MVGFSVPTFFTGLVTIVIFSVNLGWFPSVYNTTHKVTDWASFVFQVKQMIMPVTVLAFYSAAQLSRFTRSSMLENLNLDYVRTARSKGFKGTSCYYWSCTAKQPDPSGNPDCTGNPTNICRRNYYRTDFQGQWLRSPADHRHPGCRYSLVQSLTFIFAVLIVAFNILVDLLYGVLDPRIRYD